MLRNFGVTGLVASVMGVFVLALQALTPAPELPPGMSNGQGPNSNGIAASAAVQPGIGITTMTPQQPPAGQSTAATISQPGSTMAQTQPASMQKQKMPMMGMCGGMMKMMMGGQMNQGGQTNQPGGTMQQTTPAQNQPAATPAAQPTASVARR